MTQALRDARDLLLVANRDNGGPSDDIRESRISSKELLAKLAKQAEREHRARDAAMPGITQALRDAPDLLLANRDNP